MSKFIVITSIFEPTEAVRTFASLPDYRLIVVGDRKTPKNWHLPEVSFFSIERQQQSKFSLNRHLPENHYCRKMLGYLHAISEGAECVIDTDDDNLPLPHWGFPDFFGEFHTVPGDYGFVNIYELYTRQKIWPRGLPLDAIKRSESIKHADIKKRKTSVGVWQGLANEDPDVDAIYRLTSDAPCVFQDAGQFVIGAGTIVPFNSQNTCFSRSMFPLLYLPAFVSFRFTDILRGLLAQPIMWLFDRHLGFTNATVVQKRNPHDYMRDFASEIPMYLHTKKVVELVSEKISSRLSIEDNFYEAYRELINHGIVPDEENRTLEAWLKDLQKVSS